MVCKATRPRQTPTGLFDSKSQSMIYTEKDNISDKQFLQMALSAVCCAAKGEAPSEWMLSVFRTGRRCSFKGAWSEQTSRQQSRFIKGVGSFVNVFLLDCVSWLGAFVLSFRSVSVLSSIYIYPGSSVLMSQDSLVFICRHLEPFSTGGNKRKGFLPTQYPWSIPK